MPAVGATVTVDTYAPRGTGSISIVFSSQDGGALGEFIATLLITDPRGRRTGLDVASGATLKEIPRAWYDDEVIEDPQEEGSGMATRVIEITAPEAGSYTLAVQAGERGTYDLSIRAYDFRLEPSGREFRDVAIEAGEIHSYVLTFDPASGVAVAASER